MNASKTQTYSVYPQTSDNDPLESVLTHCLNISLPVISIRITALTLKIINVAFTCISAVLLVKD
jgi:hypothetical protein